MLHTQDGKVEEFFFTECCKARLDDVLCIHAAADLRKERSIAGNSIFYTSRQAFCRLLK